MIGWLKLLGIDSTRLQKGLVQQMVIQMPPLSSLGLTRIPWNLSFRYILFHDKRLQKMLWHLYAKVNSHQRWKQTRFRVCFHLWCELTSKINVTEWQVPWSSWFNDQFSWQTMASLWVSALLRGIMRNSTWNHIRCLIWWMWRPPNVYQYLQKESFILKAHHFI